MDHSGRRRLLAVGLAGLGLAFVLVVGAQAPAGANPGDAQAARADAAAATYYCGEEPVVGNDGPNGIFAPACQFHDDCYWGGTGGHTYYGNRLTCDTVFYALMWAACDAHAPYASCYAQATLYYTIVRNVGWAFWWGNWWDNV
jgi:hypothetical protein